MAFHRIASLEIRGIAEDELVHHDAEDQHQGEDNGDEEALGFRARLFQCSWMKDFRLGMLFVAQMVNATPAPTIGQGRQMY